MDTVKESLRLLDAVLRHSDSDTLIVMGDLYVRSCKAYEEGNYNLCLITAWTIAEKLLNELWQRYVRENREREIGGATVEFLTGDRKRNLLNGRDYSASVISEILSLTDCLPFDLYQDLSKVRRARNEWIHELEPAYWRTSHESALLAVGVAQRMLALVEEISFKVTLSGIPFSI